jgi:hypothetical protein
MTPHAVTASGMPAIAAGMASAARPAASRVTLAGSLGRSGGASSR